MKKFVLLLLIFSASAAYGEIYTWKDARGTVFYTNSLNEIPARYLKKARVLDVATGKKGALATAQQPTGQSGPAAPGQASSQAPGQAPARYPVPAQVPVVAPSTTPTVITPTPPSIPPAASVSAPQQQSRGSRTERRSQRRRNYSAPEEE